MPIKVEKLEWEAKTTGRYGEVRTIFKLDLSGLTAAVIAEIRKFMTAAGHTEIPQPPKESPTSPLP